MSGGRLAVVIDRFDGPEALTLRPLPRRAPGTSEIEVQVNAASINPIDVRRRAGYGRKAFALIGAARMPLVLGNDFAGIVTAVGHGVSGLREGDAVFGAKPPSSAGTHATHVVVRAEHAVKQPAGAAMPALAALPYNFLTASRALADAGLDSRSARGRSVLIHGATGGLGLLATRILASWGAKVTAVGGSAGLAACRSAGAAVAVARDPNPLRGLPRHFAATLNFANWDDDVLLLEQLAPDALGHATTVHPLLGNIDRYSLLRGATANVCQKRQMRALAPRSARYAWTVFKPDPNALAHLADMAPDLTSSVTCAEFPLEMARHAHLHVEQRRPGRAVLVPNPT